MNKTKFTFNSFLLIITLFSVLAFFLLLASTNLTNWYHFKSEWPIEGTDYSIRYASEESGIFNHLNEMKIEGYFGQGWDCEMKDGKLYCSEYHYTTFGMMKCDFVIIDLTTFEKTVVCKNATMRGICASGEVVYLSGYIPPIIDPAANRLRMLACTSDPSFSPDPETVRVCYYDPGSGRTVLEFCQEDAIDSDVMDDLLSQTLDYAREYSSAMRQ